MFLFMSSEQDIQKTIKEIEARPRVPPPDPSLFTGTIPQLINTPRRIFDRTVAPWVDDDTLHSRIDPATQGLAA